MAILAERSVDWFVRARLGWLRQRQGLLFYRRVRCALGLVGYANGRGLPFYCLEKFQREATFSWRLESCSLTLTCEGERNATWPHGVIELGRPKRVSVSQQA